MAMQWTTERADSRGFTLVELMVVIVIASILMAIAVPSYKNSIRKSRRTDAKTALLDLAGREERFNSTNGFLNASWTWDDPVKRLLAECRESNTAGNLLHSITETDATT